MSTPGLLLLPAALLAAAPSFTAEPGPAEAGRIIQASGGVSITAADGSSRRAIRGARLHAGETLSTDANGLLQVRLLDNGLLSLESGTSMDILVFDYNGPARDSEIRYRLEQGGFRTIGGSASIHVESSHASLEADPGGSFQCHLDNELYCGAGSGRIAMNNQAGSLALGIGGDHDYALVATPASAPLGLLDRPAQLGGVTPSPASGMDSSSRSRFGPGRSIPPPSGSNASPRTISGDFPEPAPIVITPEKR